MIDTHIHILPGIDDGCANFTQSLRLARLAVANGINEIVATPHLFYEGKVNDLSVVTPLVAELQKKLDEEGIPLKIWPGAEVPIDAGVGELIRKREVPTLGPQSRYVLVEPPLLQLPYRLDDFLFRLQAFGYAPIIAHPERNAQIQADPSLIYEIFPEGVALQITSFSLTGEMGKPAQDCALELLKMGFPILLASDAHSPDWRPPQLKSAQEIAATIVGPEYARQMVEDLPCAVLQGKELWPPPPPQPTFWERLKGLIKGRKPKEIL